MHGRVGKGNCLESSRSARACGFESYCIRHPPLDPYGGGAACKAAASGPRCSTHRRWTIQQVVSSTAENTGLQNRSWWFDPTTACHVGSWRKGQRRGLIIPGLQVRVLPGPPHVPVSLFGKTPDSGSGMVGSSPAREATCQFSHESMRHPPLIAQVAAGLRQRNDRRVPMGLIEAHALAAELAPHAPVAQEDRAAAS